MSAPTILVTGATGVIGMDVCAALARLDGVNVRAAVRSPSKRSLLPENVEPVSLHFDDPDSIDAALVGVEKIFLLTPGGPLGPKNTRAIVERLEGTSVRQIVKQSSFTPRREPQAPTDIWALEAEEIVIGADLEWTFLEPPWINQNFTRGYFVPLLARGILTLPFGDGKAGWIDGRDVAEVTARCLTEPGHAGKRYCLTGPEAISLHDIAGTLTEVTGKTIRYRHLTDEEWILQSTQAGAPEEMARATLALIAKTRDGLAEDVTDDVEQICGRAPIGFERFAKDYRDELSALASSNES